MMDIQEIEKRQDERKEALYREREVLKQKFSDLFHEDATIQCGTGWLNLIHETCEKLSQADTDVKIDGIGEKFGALRIMFNHSDKAALEIISKAEEASYSVCEVCGEPGHKQAGSWIKVRCMPCQSEHSTYLKLLQKST